MAANEQLMIAEPNGRALVELKQPTPMHLLEMAMSQGLDADKMGKLMELQFQWEKNEARKAYIAAIQAFKANPPDIAKTHTVSYPNKDGSKTTYKHAELDKINQIIGESLKAVGITSNWRTSDVGGRITVTCVLTHALGHSEDVSTLSGPADTSGGKNNIQAIGSTTTYLQRYTLLAGLGLAAVGADDDGRTEGMDPQAIEEYLSTINDATSIPELQRVWTDAHKAAKAIKDLVAIKTFQEAKDQRKAELQ